MEQDGGELQALLKVTASVAASMTYARLAAGSTNPGMPRLLALLPVVLLLPYLPFLFSSLHLRTISAFFLAWLGVFKLLLLAAGLGPLSPSLPLPTFIAVSSLPVKLRSDSSPPESKSSNFSFLDFILPICIKSALLASIIKLYQHKPEIRSHFYLLLAIYCFHIYLALEIVLALAGLFAGSLFGLEIEPQFDAPFRSTSLQDFWGRRWNLMVTGILRPAVYHPVRARLGTAAGFVAVFLVSGLMHEVMFSYITGQGPTGEVTAFFLIHGVCTAAEVRARKAGWWRPPAGVGTVLTLGFVAGTGFWLFFPPVVRGDADERTVGECVAAVAALEEAGRAVWRRLLEGTDLLF